MENCFQKSAILHPMNHKQFVFFDCECANTYDGIGKICSLGYVITDDELNVIESEDVVMNPECDFDWYLLSGKNECHLAYSKDYFRIKPNYESYYKEIKKLLTTGNRYIAGYAVGNDVGFINSANERYELPYIQFRAFDLERLLNANYEERRKLKEWAEFFGVNVAKFQSHKSVDDAMMTMLCLKKFCQQQGKTCEQIMNENKGMFVSNEQILQQAEERAYRKEMTEKIKRLFNKKNPMPRHKSLLGKHIELDGKILRDVDYAFALVKRIYDCGGIIHEHCTGSGLSVFDVEDVNELNPNLVKKIQNRGLEVVTLSGLEELLG